MFLRAGTRIYLRGLDVAETGTQWGDMAKWGMEMIAGAELRCHLTGDKFDDPRFRDWEIGYCTRPDGADIAAELVRSGVALACPRVDDRYVRFETDTEAKRLMPQPRSSHCAKQGAS